MNRHPDRMIQSDLLLNVSFNRGDATDRSMFNRTPTVSGATTTGRVATFDGVNDFISYPSATALNQYPMTVSFWFDMQSNEQAQYASLVDKYATGTANGWQIWTDTSERIRAWYFGGSVSNSIYGGGDGLLLTTSGYRTAGWTYCAVVFSSSGGEIFINGVSQDTQGWTGTPTQTTSTHRVALGEHNLGRYFKGQLDDVRIYNRALSQVEIAQIYASGRE